MFEWFEKALTDNSVRIYVASSWKCEKEVLLVAKAFRVHGLRVYCFAELGEGQHVFMWPDVTNNEHDGITCLKLEDSKKAYGVDKRGLDWANVCVLINPCGRDAHLEAGYIKGKGGRLYILGSFPVGEFSNMYHLADGLYRYEDLNALIGLLKEVNRVGV